MSERRFFYLPKAKEETELPLEEALHALRVLRLKTGDEIFLISGDGNFYRSRITSIAQKSCSYEILEVLPQEKPWGAWIHLAVAPTKALERIEWFCEKATEIGIDEITFIDCQFSERKVLKTQRIEKIITSAMKQSHKAWMPKINPIVKFKDFITNSPKGNKYIAHCHEEIPRRDLFKEIYSKPTKEGITLLIGPEGDFSLDEVKLAMSFGYIPVSLGESRLRTETAALMGVVISQISLSKKDEGVTKG